jgi:hypothetical protein
LIADANVASNAEIAVSKLGNGTARQLLQTDSAGTGVEWASNIDVPGTLDVTGATTLDNTLDVTGLITASGGVSGNLTGNADTATALSSSRTFALTGDITGSVSSDLTSGASIATSIGSGVIVDADINASAEIAVSKLADGTARQLLQTDSAGTGVEWTDNVDVPGTLDVTGIATFDTDVVFGGAIDEKVYNLTGTALDPNNGTIQYITLAANTTFTDSLAEGESMTLMIDDGTAYTVTWPTTTWVNNAGSAPTLATTGYTVVVLWKVSTTLYGALVGDGS